MAGVLRKWRGTLDLHDLLGISGTKDIRHRIRSSRREKIEAHSILTVWLPPCVKALTCTRG